MARKKAPKKPAGKTEKRKQDDVDEAPHPPRPFWSGVIAFGLVSLPVSLFPASRGRPMSLSMADEQGNRLRRRYFNGSESATLERDDIVRGYPIDDKQFILVEDEELESLAPDKTREIDLQRFVPLDGLNPVYFERGYFLAPDSDTTKAYRLLARALEEEQRAGIATFVMRDREYLIAIMSERGILRAETLRFHDELRSPAQVGLPEHPEKPAKKTLDAMLKAIRAHSRKTLDPDILVEDQVEQLRKLVERKFEEHTDVVTHEPAEAEPEEESNVVDLMQVLKERLRGEGGAGSNRNDRDEARDDDAAQLNREELYARAQQRGIAGRSKMTKQQLRQALKQAS